MCRAPALKYGDVNTETTSPGEVKGLIVTVILCQKLSGENVYIDIKKGYQYLGSGLCWGLTSFGDGIDIGIGGEIGIRALSQHNKVFVGMMLLLNFSEALGLYGLTVSLILVQQQFYIIFNIIYILI